jgi:hypothetical protein
MEDHFFELERISIHVSHYIGGLKAPKVSGAIDVVDFIQARAFEVNAMESSIKNAR